MFTDLSSTSKNTQPGECVVVKIRLSKGIRGAAQENDIHVRDMLQGSLLGIMDMKVSAY